MTYNSGMLRAMIFNSARLRYFTRFTVPSNPLWLIERTNVSINARDEKYKTSRGLAAFHHRGEKYRSRGKTAA